MDEDLIRLRRSLAMAPSLPGDQVAWLLDEVEQLRRSRRDLAKELEAVVDHLQRLRSQMNS